jgi:hypothetical protein
LDGDWSAAEVDERDHGVGAVEAVAAVVDQSDAGVECFEAAVGEAEHDCVEHALAVFAQGAGQALEGRELGLLGRGEPGVEERGRVAGRDLVDGAQLFFEQVGLVEALVFVLQEGEQLGLGFA